MLQPEQVKPLLLHESSAVRNLAADYFHLRRSRDSEIVTLVASAVAQFGVRNCRRLLFPAKFWPSMPDSCEQLLWLWNQVGEEPVERRGCGMTRRPFRCFLAEAFLRAPIDFLKQHAAQIEESPYLCPEFSEALAERNRWTNCSPDELWEEIQTLVRHWDSSDNAGWMEWDLDSIPPKDDKSLAEADGADEKGPQLGDYSDSDQELFDCVPVPRLNSPHVQWLMAEVAASAVPNDDQLTQMLQSLDPNTGSWLAPVVLEIAGQRRLKDSVPWIADFLDGDDIASSTAAQALIEINSDEVATNFKDRWNQESSTWQISVAFIVNGLSCPNAEATTLAILERCDDPLIQVNLVAALCQNFSERGLEIAKQLVVNGYDVGEVNLEEFVRPMSDALGREFVETPEWLAAVEQRRLEREQCREVECDDDDDLIFGDPDDDFEYVDDGLANDNDYVRPVLDRSLATPISEDTVIRLTPKIGRNDPCPCGSGKKYKKCCGIEGQ